MTVKSSLEKRSVVLVNGFSTGFAAEALLALAGFAELDDVVVVGFAEVRAVLTGTKVAYLREVGHHG